MSIRIRKLIKSLRLLALANFGASLILTTGILLSSCSSVVKPNFYRMSDAELLAYNLTVAGPEQITRLEMQIDTHQNTEKICGSLKEIQHSIEPVLPGAKIYSLPLFSPIESEKNSRSTNPQLRPIVRRAL